MKRTVLVIDDDKMILDMIQGVLADKFDVSAVNDGQKAFRVLERVRPDIILLDLNNACDIIIRRIHKKTNHRTLIVNLTIRSDNNPGLLLLSGNSR